MTELTITPKVADKTARFKGTIAAGEHVAVTIKGGAEWIGTDNGANLTLRVLDLVTGRTLAVFPYWTEDNSEDWPEGLESADAWAPAADDANDLYCELNLNTTRMVAAARHMLRVPVMFVLGDTDDPRTLYFRDRYEVEYWPERIGDTTPYDLDRWPKQIDEWAEMVADWTAQLNAMKLEATREASPASGYPYVEITLNDGMGGTDTKVKVYDGEVSTSAMNTAISAMGNTKVDKTTTVNGHALSSNVTITKADVGLGDVANTRDSATPVSGGTTKFTTGGAYTELAKKADKVAGATNGHFAGLDSSGNLKDSGKKASDFATAADKASLQTAISDEATARSNADTSLGDRITTLENKVPSGASSSNKLADRAFVNSSISTNTANYISNNGEPFASVAALNAYSGTKTNNDYAFVVGEDSDGNTTYTRYKWDGSQWAEEYVLNNSSFTAAQWAAISSGITANAVTKLNGVEAGAQVNVIETVKVNGTALVPTGKAVDVNVPSIDSTLAQQGAAADAKAVGDALRGGFTEWEFSGDTQSGDVYTVAITSPEAGYYIYTLYANKSALATATYTTDDILTAVFNVGFDSTITATRHAFPPTKTSQLTNDGAPNGGGTPYATTAQVAAKQDALSAAQLANIAAVPNKANLTDLPYRLVEPGEWEFSGSGYDPDATYTIRFDAEQVEWNLYEGEMESETLVDGPVSGTASDTAVEFAYAGITATRPSLPGHLLDRAGNRVVVSGDTTLTLPAANPGYLRDFLVRLEISGSTVPTITFAAPTGETITYETDGDEFPVPDEAGDWLYSFTESCVAHKFAVSLKKVNEVAAPQAQGGV